MQPNNDNTSSALRLIQEEKVESPEKLSEDHKPAVESIKSNEAEFILLEKTSEKLFDDSVFIQSLIQEAKVKTQNYLDEISAKRYTFLGYINTGDNRAKVLQAILENPKISNNYKLLSLWVLSKCESRLAFSLKLILCTEEVRSLNIMNRFIVYFKEYGLRLQIVAEKLMIAFEKAKPESFECIGDEVEFLRTTMNPNNKKYKI